MRNLVLAGLVFLAGALAGVGAANVPQVEAQAVGDVSTKTVATFNNGAVEFQVDYDNSDRIVALRCINNSEGDVWGEVTRQDNGRSYSKTFAAHTNTYIPIPTGVAQRIQFDGFGVHNEFVGLSLRFRG